MNPFKRKPKIKKYEYKVLSIRIASPEVLDGWGEQGLELVAATTANGGEYIFKREKK
jgi:hypothetical protein